MENVDSPPDPTTSSTELPASIIYHKDRVTVIDIPTSISEAQGNSVWTPTPSLLSCPPILAPYPNHEPKSEAARASLRAKMSTANDVIYTDLIASSLAAVHHSLSGPWCLSREHVVQSVDSLPKKRKVADIATEIDPSTAHDLLSQLSGRTSSPKDFTLRWHKARDQQPEDEETSHSEAFEWRGSLCNLLNVSRLLEITSSSMVKPARFRIPPRAAFYLGDCTTDTRPFHMAVREIAHQMETPRQFDVIVMDPPWPNASVKRTAKSGAAAYQVSPTIWDVRQLIFEMSLDALLANQGVIAVWITNKPAVRDLVLGPDGFFESWGVQLEEEWLWIKTTMHGEPVSALDALWRKPYEVLLLGRKRDESSNDQQVGGVSSGDSGSEPKVERRVIFGVPDLHSRKPCLKQLFDRFVQTRASKHRILEVFARYLVQDWMSFGNQVLKFNQDECWI